MGRVAFRRFDVLGGGHRRGLGIQGVHASLSITSLLQALICTPPQRGCACQQGLGGRSAVLWHHPARSPVRPSVLFRAKRFLSRGLSSSYPSPCSVHQQLIHHLYTCGRSTAASASIRKDEEAVSVPLAVSMSLDSALRSPALGALVLALCSLHLLTRTRLRAEAHMPASTRTWTH